MSKNLPVLKFLLFPFFGYFTYSAYCYYSQQYEQTFKTNYAPIKFFEQLYKKYKNCKTTQQLQAAMLHTVKHTNRFIINPSLIEKKVESIAIPVLNQNQLATDYLIKKEISVNHFNKISTAKQGKFVFGFWNDLTETSSYWMTETQVCENVLEKMVKNRSKRCSEIHSSEKMKHLSYMSEYETCMERTQESSNILRRYLQVIKLMKNQK